MNNTRAGIRILVAEEEHGSRNLISLALKHEGYSADFVDDPAEVSLRLQTGTQYSAIVVNLGMNGSARKIIDEARSVSRQIPVVGLMDEGVSGIDTGSVNEVLRKPITGEKIRSAIENCVLLECQDKAGAGRPAFVSEFSMPSSVWRNEMQPLIRHVAGADVPVLVQGETGSGKEVLARQLHSLSVRSKKPFLKVNCAALPSELVESELFGYERGAFTGAFKTTAGKFEMADGGTILLDEIGDMDFKLQAKLLQILQDSEFIRLGASTPRRVDVRVIAATHCNLERAIAEGRFREDLYYRLNVVTLHVPPLRDRKDEILPLTHYFLRRHATNTMPMVEITPALRDALLSHDWPGNVRELENVIRKLLVLRRTELVIEDMRVRVRRADRTHAITTVARETASIGVPKLVPDGREEMAAAAAAGASGLLTAGTPLVQAPDATTYRVPEQIMVARPVPVQHNGASKPMATVNAIDEGRASVFERADQARREAETDAILEALNSTLWNRKRAAKLLNIDYKALLYKMKKLGIVDRATKIAI